LPAVARLLNIKIVWTIAKEGNIFGSYRPLSRGMKWYLYSLKAQNPSLCTIIFCCFFFLCQYRGAFAQAFPLHLIQMKINSQPVTFISSSHKFPSNFDE
jgi:hypothetical protein